MSVQVKICGLTTLYDVECAVKHGADYLGFIFFPPSPRNIDPNVVKTFEQAIPDNVKKVAVFVDPDEKEIERVFDAFTPDYVQLHGDETEAFIYALHMKYAVPVIKAIAVRSSDDVARGLVYANIADMLMFDAKVPDSPLPGGNGLAFDWALLREREFQVPWFLSGGLNVDNVEEAVSISGAKAVDVSSSLESEPGVKDPELIKAFLKKVKSL